MKLSVAEYSMTGLLFVFNMILLVVVSPFALIGALAIKLFDKEVKLKRRNYGKANGSNRNNNAG